MKESFSDKIVRIGNRAVKMAQEENRRKGIPNVYSINGKMIFELPDGTLTTTYSYNKHYAGEFLFCEIFL